MRVLLVCLGNICRSAAAQGVLQAHAPDWHIASAGTGGWHVGEPPYPPMQAAALSRGYDISAQRAAQVTPADFMRYDLILAMDAQNLADLRAIRPADATATLRQFAHSDVPDPYYTRDFDGCLSMIEAEVPAVINDTSALLSR